ncbi:hypothetical protein N8Z47_00620 [Salibacteraceae bacterium]|nr:hypothetical protein [Salibacteraceae bacterium]
MSISNSKPIDRITMLWAITECGLGGFFHAIQSPFTGLLVGGLSVIYISMIALISKQKAHESWPSQARAIVYDIGKSALFVLLVKALISPHSPIGAYFAVSLQAIIGIILFGLIPSFKLAAIITSVLATVSSAVQKILILLLLFGSSLFEAIDGFILAASQKLHFVNLPAGFSTSKTLALTYVAVYAIGGICIGIIAIQMPSWMNKRASELGAIMSEYGTLDFKNLKQPKKQKSFAIILFVGLLIITLSFQFFFVSSESALWQLIRTTSILIIWFLFIRPILKWWVSRLAEKNKHGLKQQLGIIKHDLPRIASFVPFALRKSRSMPGIWVSNFILLFIYFGLNET